MLLNRLRDACVFFTKRLVSMVRINDALRHANPCEQYSALFELALSLMASAIRYGCCTANDSDPPPECGEVPWHLLMETFVTNRANNECLEKCDSQLHATFILGTIHLVLLSDSEDSTVRKEPSYVFRVPWQKNMGPMDLEPQDIMSIVRRFSGGRRSPITFGVDDGGAFCLVRSLCHKVYLDIRQWRRYSEMCYFERSQPILEYMYKDPRPPLRTSGHVPWCVCGRFDICQRTLPFRFVFGKPNSPGPLETHEIRTAAGRAIAFRTYSFPFLSNGTTRTISSSRLSRSRGRRASPNRNDRPVRSDLTTSTQFAVPTVTAPQRRSRLSRSRRYRQGASRPEVASTSGPSAIRLDNDNNLQTPNGAGTS